MSALYPPAVAAEIFWVRSRPWRNVHGETICCAFGYRRPEDLLDNEPGYPEWPFEIDYDRVGQRLRMCIDTYEQIGDRFDDEAWEAAKMHFDIPATREGYVELQRIARSLLAGRTIQYEDGTKLSLERWRAQP